MQVGYKQQRSVQSVFNACSHHTPLSEHVAQFNERHKVIPSVAIFTHTETGADVLRLRADCRCDQCPTGEAAWDWEPAQAADPHHE